MPPSHDTRSRERAHRQIRPPHMHFVYLQTAATDCGRAVSHPSHYTSSSSSSSTSSVSSSSSSFRDFFAEALLPPFAPIRGGGSEILRSRSNPARQTHSLTSSLTPATSTLPTKSDKASMRTKRKRSALTKGCRDIKHPIIKNPV